MPTDIQNKADIQVLVDRFYEKIRLNEVLGPIFIDLAKVNWETHLPKMYNFWNMVLFEELGYEGHPLRPHLAINAQQPLSPMHFDTWLNLFDETVDEIFEGEKATEIKLRAKNVAMSWAYKIDYMNKLAAN
ncbi:MAG: group III truncated hemoglobin [Bacteroidota bacterium]